MAFLFSHSCDRCDSRRRRPLRGAGVAVVVLLSVFLTSSAQAQFRLRSPLRPAELSDNVDIEDTDIGRVRARLENAKALAAGKQWDEVVETLRQILEQHGDKLIQLTDRRYVRVRDFCHIQFAGLSDDALALYRARVDPVAAIWYADASKDRDEKVLTEIVDGLFCSSYGDDALWLLGEIALERGRYEMARRYWERISPLLRMPDGQQLWQGLVGVDLAAKWNDLKKGFESRTTVPDWLVYPDTDLDLATVRARLVLVSILEGTRERALTELAAFGRLHPTARGRLAGKTGLYSEILQDLLAKSRSWSGQIKNSDWPTFAGSATRNRHLLEAFEIGGNLKGYLDLPDVASASSGSQLEVANLLRYHPVVVGDLVFINGQNRVLAFDLRTGKGWPPGNDGGGGKITGQIYQSSSSSSVRSSTRGRFEQPRYTLSVHDDKLFARMGSPSTVRAVNSFASRGASHVICLDLKREGYKLWKLPHDDDRTRLDSETWSFEGSPVTDGTNVYVGLTRNNIGGVKPEAHVGCFDASNGKMKWRRAICRAHTNHTMTHNLLTLHEDTVYYNSNLGTVAALSGKDGRVQWIYHYERSRDSNLYETREHLHRDLNPCVYYRGMVIVGPRDSKSIFALDAMTGKHLWRNGPLDSGHPVHLLGVGDGNLIATGRSIWWFDAATGKCRGKWPGPDNSLDRFGRGILAGGLVFWPTRERIHVFEQRLGPRSSAKKVNEIRLDLGLYADRLPVTGGNLVFAGDYALIAAPNKLYVWGPGPPWDAATEKRDEDDKEKSK